MERIIHHKPVCALKFKHLISDSQHGFPHKCLLLFYFWQLMTKYFALKDGTEFTVHCIMLFLIASSNIIY